MELREVLYIIVDKKLLLELCATNFNDRELQKSFSHIVNALKIY